MVGIDLRDAQTGDEAAIRTVTLAAYEQYASIMGPMWKFYLQNIEETLADVKPAEQIVAVQDAKVTGTVLLYPAGTAFDEPGNGADHAQAAPEVRLLAVAPEARGTGVGKALMEECIRRTKAAGIPSLTLHTNEMMAVAMAMYERMGFARAPELDFTPAPNIVIKGFRYSFENGQGK